MSNLVNPHGGGGLKVLLLEGQARKDELKKAEGFKRVPMTTRETSDLIMLGIGAFTPLDGFMGKEDWKGICDNFTMPSLKGLFWPIPITLSTTKELADSIGTALVTTRLGLGVAIPALSAYAILRNKIDGNTSEAMVVSQELISTFRPTA